MRGNIVGIVYRDVITAILAIFVLLVVSMLSYISDPTTKPVDAGLASPGALSVSIAWPPGDVDVDLWLMAPGEKSPVFYRNRGGVVWDLLRDDLGYFADVGYLNYENAFTRGAPEGDYRINIFCFRCPEGPVPVTVEVQERDGSARLKDVSKTQVTLKGTGDEKTAIAFKVGPDGTVIDSSMNTFFESLREEVTK